MTENKPIKTVSGGITVLSTGRYYDGINQWIAHSIKEGDSDAIDYAARRMAPSYQPMLSLFLFPVIMELQTRPYVWHKPSRLILVSLS